MNTKQCKKCNGEFEVNPKYPNNQMCRVCYFEERQNGTAPAVVQNNSEGDRTDKIAMMSIIRGLCQLKQDKKYAVTKLIEDSKRVYKELF